MIKTWIADIRPLYEEMCYRRYYNQIPQFRQEKADKLRLHQKKAQSVGAWVLWEQVKQQYHITEQTIYNLSHSGDYVLCSADMNGTRAVQVGCDIEQIKTAHLQVAKRFYCPAEYQQVLAQDTAEKQNEVFYRFWVLKESFMKATRKGMALDPRSFEIQLGNPPQLVKQPDELEDRYYYREYELSSIPYKIAVCSTAREIEPELTVELML